VFYANFRRRKHKRMS